MIRLRHKIMLGMLRVFDQLAMLFAFAMAASIVSHQIEGISISDFFAMRIKTQNFFLFICFITVWYIIFTSFVPYHGRRLSKLWTEIRAIVNATSLGTLALWIVSVPFHLEMINHLFLYSFWLISTGIIVSSRVLMHYMLRRVRLYGRNLRHILFIGANKRAVQFAKKLEVKRELGYIIVGFMDNTWDGIEDFKGSGYRLIGAISELQSYIKWNVVDEVMICLPIKSFYDEAADIVALCEEQGIVVRFIPSVFDFQLARSKIEHFEGEYIITFFRESLHWQLLVKRFLDFCICLAALAVVMPLGLLIAAAIKLTSPGPVLFIQERVGLNKRRFNLYKFRTMVHDAEVLQSEIEYLNEASGPVFKIRDDPRMTSLGKILRKTSLDELPQLMNVLKGDMSLVGPRPLPVRDYAGFDKDWHRRRLSVRPGITCLWQIGGRSNVSFERWMELDRQYIDNWSLWLDLKIIAKTVPAVIRGAGAT